MTAQPREVPAGQVDIAPHGTGWYLVQIGRGRYTKRFNLSDNELRQIAAWADADMPREDS